MQVFKTNIGDSASALKGKDSIKGNPKKRGPSESMDVAEVTKKPRLEDSNPDGQKEKNSADSNQAGEEPQTNLEDHEHQIHQPDEEDKEDKKEKAGDEMETDQRDENTEKKKEKAGDKDNEMETGQSTTVGEDQTGRFDETADEIESIEKIIANAPADVPANAPADDNTSKNSSADEGHNTSKNLFADEH